MRERLYRALRALYRIEAGLAAAAYATTAGLLLADVVAREILAESILGAQKAAVFAAIIAGFLGLALATASNSHLRPNIIDGLLPARWSGGLEIAGDLVAAAVYIVLGVVAIGYVKDSIAYGETAMVLYVPLWPFQLVLPYAFLSSALRHLGFATLPNLKPSQSGEG